MDSEINDGHRAARRRGNSVDAEARIEAERLLRRRAASKRASARVFTDGEVLAGRYRVLELLDQGGAGQVYRVLDEELGEQVALKTLHPATAASSGALEQFKQELRLARTVTHEHVCRLFELGRHGYGRHGYGRDGEGDDGVFFLTMELVEGETLADLAARRGPLPFELLVDLGLQVASGLRAAHRKGVVHRDLKSQNVLLQRVDGGTPRAVLTDFGLAKVTAREEIDDLREGDRALVGTPLSMAPEQVRGGEVGPAADVYGFGVLLYQLATGTWPFSAATPLAAAVRRLEEAPEPPRQRRPDLPEAFEALVLDCLRLDAAQRPGIDAVIRRLSAWSSSTVASSEPESSEPESSKPESIEPESTGPESTEPGHAADLPRARRRPVIALEALPWLAAALAAVAVAALLWRPGSPAEDRRQAEKPAASQTPSVPARPSLLWLGLKSPGEEDLRWLKTLVEESLLASLQATGELRVVAGEPALRIRREVRAWPYFATGRRAPRPSLAGRAGVDHVLAGRAEAAGDGRLRIELELGKGQASLNAVVDASDLSGLGDQLGGLAARLRSALALGAASDEQDATARAEIPSHPEAARLYAQGLQAFRRFETRTAADLLRRSLELEPNHPKVLAALATVWMRLGYAAEAKQAAKQAFEHAGGLARAEQMAIEASFHLRHRQWQRAQEVFAALWEFFPDEPRHGLGLLEAQDRAGDIDGALATLERLRLRGDSPAPQRARFDLAESMVAYHQGDYERSQRAARRAREIGEQLAAPSLIAEALVQEALTRITTDADLVPVEEMLERATRILAQLGEPRSLVRAQLYLADCARRRDRFAAAEKAYLEAIETATSIGNGADLDRARTSLAILLDRQGLLRRGLVLKQQVLQSYRERQVIQGAVIAQENVAISLLKMGRPAEALIELAAVEQRYDELGDRIGLAWSPYYQGRAWLDRGELALAERHLRKASDAAKEPDLPAAEELASAVDFELARLAWSRGELEGARELVEPLLGFYEGVGQPFGVAEVRLLLARVHRSLAGAETARLDRAEGLARLALEHFESAEIVHQVVAAKTELATIELARFQFRGASELPPELPSPAPPPACRELAAVPDIEHRRLALLASVVRLTCHAPWASGPSSTVELERVIAEAEELQLFLPELRARLLRASWNASAGRTDGEPLSALRREAARRGFDLQTAAGAPRG